MAENLNVPSDFTKPKPKGPDIGLLPPSAFEAKLKSGDPWKEIAKATEEVAKLKLENTKLREGWHPPVSLPVQAQIIQEPISKPPQEICKYPDRKEELKYVDELIQKQASEITELKNELRTLKCQHREEVTEMERQMTLKEREYIHTVSGLEAELRNSEDRYDTQIDRLSREHQRETDELAEKVEKLQDERTVLKEQARERIEGLELELKSLQDSATERINSLTQELRAKEGEIENQLKQISQLKKYIGESENIPKPAEVAKREKEALLTKLKTYESERENLQSTVQLLNIRLNSMNEILKLQETEMSKGTTDIEKVKQEGLLLTRWREKVFALMVQQKSSDIVCKKDEQNWKAKVSDMENKLSSAYNQIEQLSHALSDRGAQLDMERNSNLVRLSGTDKTLQRELSEAQQLALCLDDKIQENIECAHTLQAVAESIGGRYEKNLETMVTALGNLKAYDQRLTFAVGRLDMLKGLFARREAVLKLQLENGVPVRDVPDKEQEQSQKERENQEYLQLELLAVIKERDRLAQQLREDSQTWDEKILSVRQKYEDEITSLKQTCGDLEQIIQEKTEACSSLSERLEQCQCDLDEASQTIEELKTTLAKQDMNIEQMLEEKRKETENSCAEQFADMDRKLNDAKREHAKAVVSLRQLERQSSREKERAAEHLKTVEDHYQRQIDKLQEHLKSVEKERNLMMATLRQEGLIGKIRSERSEPVTLSWDKDEETVQQVKPASPIETIDSHLHEKLAPSVGAIDSHPQIDMEKMRKISETEPIMDEPLTSVLEDLQSLTTAVLKDDDETGSESDS